jgi:hypothetical protein
MPDRDIERTITFLGVKADAERVFGDKEYVKFEIAGYVREKGKRFLEDEERPVEEFVKIQVTSVREL